MPSTLDRIRELLASGEVRISEHGYDELAADGILAGEVLDGLPEAAVVEEYPEYPKGPCVLVVQKDRQGQPPHALWGIPRGKESPAVLVTAYRPDPAGWSDDFRRRRS